KPLGVNAPERMTYQPKRSDVFAKLIIGGGNNVLQVLDIVRCPVDGLRVRSRNYETMLVLIIKRRKVMTMPVWQRAAPVQTEKEREFFLVLQIGGIVQEV